MALKVKHPEFLYNFHNLTQSRCKWRWCLGIHHARKWVIQRNFSVIFKHLKWGNGLHLQYNIRSWIFLFAISKYLKMQLLSQIKLRYNAHKVINLNMKGYWLYYIDIWREELYGLISWARLWFALSSTIYLFLFLTSFLLFISIKIFTILQIISYVCFNEKSK